MFRVWFYCYVRGIVMVTVRNRVYWGLGLQLGYGES